MRISSLQQRCDEYFGCNEFWYFQFGRMSTPYDVLCMISRGCAKCFSKSQKAPLSKDVVVEKSTGWYTIKRAGRTQEELILKFPISIKI